MTVKEVYENECKRLGEEIMFIAILDEAIGKAYLDYADEYLETHGDYEVKEYKYVGSKDCLYIEVE